VFSAIVTLPDGFSLRRARPLLISIELALTMNIITSARRSRHFQWAVYAWLATALVFALFAMRPSALVIAPIALVLWWASRTERLTQSAQLAWPVLLLPGAVLCFIGAMQSMNYGRMENEPGTQFVEARFAFFSIGVLLHLYAFWLAANESRAIDHPSGERARKI
jgi:hypothetical protein